MSIDSSVNPLKPPVTALELAPEVAEVDASGLLVIVVGAHLQAERADRALGYRLRERILQRQDELAADLGGAALEPVVCTDLWYLNARDLASRPTIALGAPGVNAATAFLASRIPTAFVIEDTLRVHVDPDFIEARACMWGANHSATVSAMDVFTERYLDGFLRAAQA